MGKRKRSRPNKFNKTKVSDAIGSAYDEGYKTVIDPNSRDYVYDEVDQYHDDIRAANLSEAVQRMKVNKSKKEKVLSLGLDSSDDDEVNQEEEDDEESDDSEDEDKEDSPKNKSLRPFLENDDIVEELEQKLPDDRAWGKNKASYYGTNVTDQHIRKRATHQHITEVREVTALELEAHKAYKKRMDDHLKKIDPMELLLLGKEVEKTSGKVAAKPKINLYNGDIFVLSAKANKSLTSEQKIKIANKLSPEYFLIVADGKDKEDENRNLLEPVLKAYKDGVVGDCNVMKYVRTKFWLNEKYTTMVVAYIMFIHKLGHNAIKTHPVMDKLAYYRFLFKQLEQKDAFIQPQLEILLDRIKNNIPLNLLHPPTPKKSSGSKNADPKPIKKLSILCKRNTEDREDDPEAKKAKLVMAEDSDSDDGGKDNAEASEELVDDSRRHIGKMITKNRGLTPHRKKSTKNPRIKYKMKYSDKLKRRKGQVREARKEIPVYRGELSGINPYVVRSRKF